MSGTNCYIFQQHYDILRELETTKYSLDQNCVSSSSSSSSSSINNNNCCSIRSSSNSRSSIYNCSSKVNVAVTVEIFSGLILSYEIRFVGLAQDITNNFRSI